MRRLVIALVASAVLSSSVCAQTVLAVPHETARFVWDVPNTSQADQYGDTDFFQIACDEVNGNLNKISTSVAGNLTDADMRLIVHQNGRYNCTLQAWNAFGVSEAVPFPAFKSGYPPETPSNARIEPQ